MNSLKVCFIGVGSIAKRHIHNLSSICDERQIELTIDAFRRSNIGENLDLLHKIYTDEELLPMDYDVIFITNPTDLHMETLERFHGHAKHFFIEKPIVSFTRIEEAKNFITRKNSVYYVACPLRYTNVIQYLKKNLNTDDVISVRCISSSYLPEWRPNTDYRDTYSAHRELGGGVSIDLIHEWDYLTYLFDTPEKVFYLSGKKSNLEIDSDDYAIYMAEYKDKIVELHLDYFGRKTIRELMIFTRDDTIRADLINMKIEWLRNGESISFLEMRDDFQKKELCHFLDIIEKEETPEEDGILHAIKVLQLTQGELER